MDAMRILVVEDDPNLVGFLVKALEEASYVVDRAGSLADARRLLAAAPYDLVSLDVNLPDGAGLDLLAELRGSGHGMPILVLSSKATAPDRVEGLDRGADDYLAKPFVLDEYLSRVRALLRRGAGRGDPVLRLGEVACDEAAHRVTCRGKDVDLTPKEFAVLRLFLKSPGAVLSRTQVVNSVWRWSFDGYSNVVDVHVSALRRKLKGSGVRFRSVPKVGYVLEEAARGGAGEEE
jgi:two-component system response regulator QseB